MRRKLKRTKKIIQLNVPSQLVGLGEIIDHQANTLQFGSHLECGSETGK